MRVWRGVLQGQTGAAEAHYPHHKSAMRPCISAVDALSRGHLLVPPDSNQRQRAQQHNLRHHKQPTRKANLQLRSLRGRRTWNIARLNASCGTNVPGPRVRHIGETDSGLHQAITMRVVPGVELERIALATRN